ncbi:MAG: TetR family transcriptional regulator [Sphingobium sp.]|nr:TetR family transcriptional regulator [Sphingobium sp.]MBP9157726.1 TetR family transcriptional regulator [Sphingobium sp.]
MFVLDLVGITDILEIVSEDHRVRVAKVRRERMVARLLQAVMECYAEHLQSGPPTVEEVIARADVSRATFYKYFNSIDEAIEQRASVLVEDMIESFKDLVETQMKPVMLFTVSVHLFLLRSVLDPTWAAFVARSDLLRAEGILFQGMTAHLAAALADHEVTFTDTEAARTIAIGTMREAIRLIAQSSHPRRVFVEEIAAMILISFGVAREVSLQLVKDATIFIRGAAPDRLPWWRDPWSGGKKLPRDSE